jgi:myo-inositol catabolism protein IolS
MHKLTLPNTDLSVSQLVFGCWGITSDFHWGTRDEQESLATIHAALDAGVNFFDTAEAYGDGNSETLLSKAFAGRRDQVVIASKMKPDSMTAELIPVAVERSLQRLGTDYLDLYQIHWPDREIPREETWNAMIKLREQGKVRSIGVCNFGLGDLDDICPVEPPVTNQLPYNLLWRAIEHDILQRCLNDGIGVLAYSPLMHGLLADKYKTAAEVPDGRARSRHFTTDRELARHGESGCETETFAAIDALRDICDDLGRSMADVALAWVAAQPAVNCVIVGARNPQQLSQNIATLANPLPADAITRISEATQQLNLTLGPNPDMWQGSGKSRYR